MSNSNCPIARAVRRQLGDGWQCGRLRVFPPESVSVFVAADLPENARKFIDRYDNGEPVDPFTFSLEVPDELLSVPVSK